MYYTRDGSYGLLRRPIRYNTLLIRHTRIIRKRIFAILGVPWACTSHPPTTTRCPQSLQNFKMPLKGPEWDHVVILGHKGQNYKMQCKYCKLKFSGGAPRIREHFIRRNPSVGVAACKADPEEIEDVVVAMAEIDDAQKEKEQHATKKRPLDRNTASMSAASGGL